ncbi:MAG TPA: ASKHA domain-containing protein [Anaeromyxobacteraceae bacterium]
MEGARRLSDGAREVHHVGVRLDGERDDAVRHLTFRAGPSLRDILNASSARVRSACAGIGACGLCRVRIDAGAAGAPTTAERLHLGEDALAAGTRLACQVTPRAGVDVTVLEPARPSPWRTIAPAYRAAHPISPARAGGLPWGAAVDVGTTQITVAICDMATGRRVAARTGPNPQARMGADVICRLEAAARSGAAGDELRDSALDAIGDALLALSQDEGIALPEVGPVRVVGNSAMLTLLSGGRADALLDPARWAGRIECTLADPGALAESWNLGRGAAIDLVEPLGGFVGSDLLAGVVHCRLAEGDPALLIDFGTNSEIALWDGARLWVTAAAGGPAFEAAGIGCGMAAEPGAVRRLTRSAEGAWLGEIIEAPPVRGICGSGLVDLVGLLASGGEIDERGRPRREPLTIVVAGAELGVSKADIDVFQRAKAAVGAGVEVLRRRSGLRFDQIAAVHVAGSFGEQVDVENAQRIGLLPPVPPERVRLAGNTALRGALDVLLSAEAGASLARARRGAKLINLSMDAAFEELFLDHLYLRPAGARS